MNSRGLLLVAALAAVSLTAATSGFTATTADRGVSVSVADDDSALLGIERSVSGTANGTTNVTVAVTNRVGTQSLTDVRLRVGDYSRAMAASGPLEPGDVRTETVAGVRCDATVHVDASAETVDISLNRSVPCP